ncbi:HypC/HybG/HupF family hydrogenase formation chaperone [Ferrimonas marina]|uniref:Hydrogenase expression/formation protein HypC n=1 Tax=Ferrimonas marina TaxID=299255 RepID=A0A1M5VG44_9GAMM|nr:HypC/HybG/HupF family hydrogenase formation chaperone [Ferrimonas marina]SHH74145.1 hydrogenase expression/formation protein HypC [Ferrimonas marina]
MCFAIPSKVLSLDSEAQIARVETLGQERDVSVHLLGPDLAVGDYLLVSHGFAMEKIDSERALDSLELYREIADKMAAGEI